MLNFKNNFLWKMLQVSKFQDPIEKFDKEFLEKSMKIAKQKEPNKHRSNLLPANKGANI